MQQNTQENKMGYMPENKLLISVSMPMVISMLVQALYNIVDSMYVSQISENALTAVSLVFPVQSLMIAIGAGTGVGVNAVLSRSLGARQFARADKVASVSLFLGAANWIVIAVLGFLLVGPFTGSQTNDPQIAEYAREYMLICTTCSFGVFFQFVFERLLQATGKTMYAMITQGVGAIINIILDPIFIFGYFGIPAMGVAGAAIATVVGQVVAAALACVFNITKNHEIHLSIKQMLPKAVILKRIYSVGVPAIIMQSVTSVMTYFFNMILIGFSSTAVAVLGVYFKVQSFIFMPVFGLNNGMVPIIAYNYGAGKRTRILKTVKLAVMYATAIMIIGILMFQFIPDKLFMLFNASEGMLEIGIPAFRIISISFIFAGFNIVMSSLYQSLGKGMYSLYVSLVRQLAVLLPAAFILSKIGGLDVVWFSFPIAEIASLTMCIIYTRRIMTKTLKNI